MRYYRLREGHNTGIRHIICFLFPRGMSKKDKAKQIFHAEAPEKNEKRQKSNGEFIRSPSPANPLSVLVAPQPMSVVAAVKVPLPKPPTPKKVLRFRNHFPQGA